VRIIALLTMTHHRFAIRACCFHLFFPLKYQTKLASSWTLIPPPPIKRLSSSYYSTCNLRPQKITTPTWLLLTNNNEDTIISSDTTDVIDESILTMTEDDEEEEDDDDDCKIILDGLNPSQIQAVTQPIQSITRVIAGPGAGKTRVLTCRIAYLLEKDTENRILAVTFTKKAAMEMKERLQTLMLTHSQYQQQLEAAYSVEKETDNYEKEDDEIYQEEDESYNPALSNTDRATFGTFHSACAKILRWNGSLLSSLPSVSMYNDTVLDGSFTIIDQTEQLRIVKQCLVECGIDLKGFSNKKDLRPITILNAVSQLKEDDAMGDNRRNNQSNKEGGMKMTARVRQIAEEVYILYQKQVLEQNSMDFNDLILKTRELLMTNPSVQDRLRKRWHHVLVDEFQDTSEAQLDVVKLLTSKSLLAVGDSDQNIYSWRGAYPESMTDFVKEFDDCDNEGGVDTVYLMENYRSTRNIVTAAQKVISSQSSSSETSSQVKIRQDMKPMRGAGPLPRVLACADSKAEATNIMKTIKKMEADGSLTPLSTIALIYRTNAQSRALEEACVAQNIRYLVRGNAGTFYSRIEIKDCLCFLKLLYNGSDKTAMMRAMKTPPRGIGEVSLNEFFSYCKDEEKRHKEKNPDAIIPTPFDILISLSQNEKGPENGILSKRTFNRLLPFSSQMKELQQKAQVETVSDLVSSIIDILDLRNHFDSISKTNDEFVDRWSNVIELRNAADRYSKDGFSLTKKTDRIIDDLEFETGGPLGNFLDDVSLLTEIDNSETDSENKEAKRLLVNLMTIHSSKGMEFDAVFLVGNEEGTFPTHLALMNGEGSIELEEERRLCYVAMTRAKTHLIMTWRREIIKFFGQGIKVQKGERSRFLDVFVTKKSSKNRKASKGRQRVLKASERRSNSDYIQSKGKNNLRRETYLSPNASEIELEARRQVLLDNRRHKKDHFNKEADRAPPPEFDSTVFYPIGTRVRHVIHGDGEVISPPSSSSHDSSLVLVKFNDEPRFEYSFPVRDSMLQLRF